MILRLKVELGKLYTSYLSAKLLMSIDPKSLVPRLINVKEFLARGVFNLHRLVKQIARQLNSDVTVFVRNGTICVKKKKNAVVQISKMEDLDNFLSQ